MLHKLAPARAVSRTLDSLFAPRSVAVVGASRDPAKWGGLLARGALKGRHRRAVGLVNRNGGEILGSPSHRTIAELPQPPELVVACVPAPALEQTVEEALAVGARAIVGISAGLAEDAERRLGRRVREADAVLLGPNCLGVFDRDEELDLAPWVDFPPGEIGLIAQSGNLSLELALLADRAGLGFSRFASLGNQADLEAAELVDSFARHEGTRLIALYVEDFRDGRAFARAAAGAGKPVVLLTVGGSDGAARAARSHTRALVSDLAVVDAACRAAGIVRVATPTELVDAAAVLLRGRRSAGRRIVVLGDGGGHGVVAADVASRAGLELPVLSPRLAADLAAVLPETATTQNPIDFAGGAERDIRSFERVVDLLLHSGETDALLVTGYFGGYGTDSERDVATAVASAATERGMPLVVHSLYPQSEAGRALAAGGGLVYGEIERAVSALETLARAGERAPGVPFVPDDAIAPVAEGYFASRELVAEAGVPMVAAVAVESASEARAAAEQLGYPVVLKSLGADHKSDAGGVVLDIRDAQELEAAFARLPRGPCSVERMAAVDAGLELIVGVRRDPRFGPLLMVGLGGVHAEVFRDVAVALAPVEPAEAEGLLRSLQCAPLLTGARGRGPLDISAAAKAASALSYLAVRAPWLAELEVNPLRVTVDGVVGLDARLVHGTMREPS
ncbi:MAG: acetate--CoA ligase family protein [Gaiellaceae bacterium]